MDLFHYVGLIILWKLFTCPQAANTSLEGHMLVSRDLSHVFFPLTAACPRRDSDYRFLTQHDDIQNLVPSHRALAHKIPPLYTRDTLSTLTFSICPTWPLQICVHNTRLLSYEDYIHRDIIWQLPWCGDTTNGTLVRALPSVTAVATVPTEHSYWLPDSTFSAKGR